MDRFFLLLVVLALATTLQAQEPKKEAPRIIAVSPLGAKQGATSKLKIRGLKLDSATEIRFHEPKTSGKILSKAKVPAPGKPEDLAMVGDTQIEVEVTLPPSPKSGAVPFSVFGPGGESLPCRLIIEEETISEEKEPNNGFRQAQELEIPQIIEGRIGHPQDVDVFRFQGKQGEKLVFEVQAARFGSTLDGMLILSEANGTTLASCDDTAESADPRLEVHLPYTGTFYLTLLDANDQGGVAQGYRLAAWRK